jgi:hypothetical protein
MKALERRVAVLEKTQQRLHRALREVMKELRRPLKLTLKRS